jgi:hypothetical protein
VRLNEKAVFKFRGSCTPKPAQEKGANDGCHPQVVGANQKISRQAAAGFQI